MQHISDSAILLEGMMSSLAGLGLLALAALPVGRRPGAIRGVYAGAGLLSALLCLFALLHLATGAGIERLVLPVGLPWTQSHFRLDALSAFFMMVMGFGGAAASFYALGYGVHERHPRRVLPFFPAFLMGMGLVLLADDAYAYLMAWEFMSLSSWAMVVSGHRNPDNVGAGYLYIVMASFGTMMLLFAFGLMAGEGGGYGFDAMRTATLPPWGAAAVFALALLGAGSKAGLIPLHVWLPEAHPAAPSHVSALMSGVMTKIAVYGFIRILFDLLGAVEWWWGVPLIVLAAATAFIGLLYALLQRDIKKILAYSTVENIGIIFFGLSLALVFRADGLKAGAALALTAALLHVLNHSLFKSLLFMAAGAVVHATGERDIEKMGGLIHRMPVTAALFLLGALAVAALPPLNGFVSEWLTFQAILASPAISQPVLTFLIPLAGAVLSLSAALAAACFVRLAGIALLGRARSEAAQAAHETDRLSLAAMAAIGVLCILLGVLSPAVVGFIAPVVDFVVGAAMPDQAMGPAFQSLVPVADAHSSYNGLILMAFIAFAGMASAWVVHRLASRAVRRGPAWDCGFPDAAANTQYSASSFSQPLRRAFATTMFGAGEQVHMPPPGDMGPARLRLTLTDPAWAFFYTPLVNMVGWVSARLNRLQFLSIRRYLSLVFMWLILLLIVVALWR